MKNLMWLFCAILSAMAVLLTSSLADAAGSNPHITMSFVATVTGTLNITIDKPFVLSFSPATPKIACNASAGTIVSTIMTAGGNGNPVTYGMKGSASFAIPSGTSTVLVAPGGILPADCGTTVVETITGTQN